MVCRQLPKFWPAWQPTKSCARRSAFATCPLWCGMTHNRLLREIMQLGTRPPFSEPLTRVNTYQYPVPAKCHQTCCPVALCRSCRNAVIELVEMPEFRNLFSALRRPSPTLRQAQGTCSRSDSTAEFRKSISARDHKEHPLWTANYCNGGSSPSR